MAQAGGQLPPQHFNCDSSVQLAIQGTKDPPHGAFANQLEQLITLLASAPRRPTMRAVLQARRRCHPGWANQLRQHEFSRWTGCRSSDQARARILKACFASSLASAGRVCQAGHRPEAQSGPLACAPLNYLCIIFESVAGYYSRKSMIEDDTFPIICQAEYNSTAVFHSCHCS